MSKLIILLTIRNLDRYTCKLPCQGLLVSEGVKASPITSDYIKGIRQITICAHIALLVCTDVNSFVLIFNDMLSAKIYYFDSFVGIFFFYIYTRIKLVFFIFVKLISFFVRKDSSPYRVDCIHSLAFRKGKYQISQFQGRIH